MNENMLIQQGDLLNVVFRRNEDGTNDGSLVIERKPGHCYCIAKAPRYASDEEWAYNTGLIISAIYRQEKFVDWMKRKAAHEGVYIADPGEE